MYRNNSLFFFSYYLSADKENTNFLLGFQNRKNLSDSQFNIGKLDSNTQCIVINNQQITGENKHLHSGA